MRPWSQSSLVCPWVPGPRARAPRVAGSHPVEQEQRWHPPALWPWASSSAQLSLCPDLWEGRKRRPERWRRYGVETTTEETRQCGGVGKRRQPAATFVLSVFLYRPETYPLSALSGFQGPPDHMRAPPVPLLENNPGCRRAGLCWGCECKSGRRNKITGCRGWTRTGKGLFTASSLFQPRGRTLNFHPEWFFFFFFQFGLPVALFPNTQTGLICNMGIQKS